MVMTGCTVSGNTGEITSAVLIDINGHGTLVDCDITGNTSVQAGGSAVRVFNQLFGLVTISGSTISGNQGTGLSVVDSNFSIDTTTLRDNDGYGLLAQGASFGCTGDIVSSAIADNRGWGVSAFNANLDVTRTIIAGNLAGVDVSDCDLALVNSTIAGNRDGGVVIDGGGSSPVSITNCTVAGNSSDSSGAGLLLGDFPSQAEVVNSIFWGNDGAGASGSLDQIDSPFGGSITVTYSSVQDGWPGTGNIDADPLFVDPRPASSAPTSDGDYHLLAASPSVDTGTAAGAPADDIDGDPRPQLMGFDMGSDEVTGAVFAHGFESGDTSGWTMTVP
jgi:hypothetical protein